MTTIYYVGPKGKDSERPWLMTGKREVAEKYADEMGGEVRAKQVESPTVFLHVKRQGQA